MRGILLAALAAAATPAHVEVQTSDVDLFYRVYDCAKGHPSVEQIQHDYLDAGTNGLSTFARVRGTTDQRSHDAIEQQPELYFRARRCAAALPAARPRLADALRRLHALYPAATSPLVTIAIGRGRPVGVGSPVKDLQIGLKALCGVPYYDPDPVDRFVHVVAHEYVHVQQRPELVDADAHWTVLGGSTTEHVRSVRR